MTTGPYDFNIFDYTQMLLTRYVVPSQIHVIRYEPLIKY